MDATTRIAFSTGMVIETYFKNMSSCWYIALLGNFRDNAEMIWLCLVHINLSDERNEACEKWKDSTVVCTYIEFQKSMSKQILQIKSEKRT